MSDRVEQKLRALLVEEADTIVSVGDPVPEVEHRMRVRARHRATLVATCLVVIATVAAGLAVGLGLRDPRKAVDPIDWPPPRPAQYTGVPFCITDPDDPDGELIVIGANPPIKRLCRWSPAFPMDHSRLNWLWHHAGSTILETTLGGNFRVADGRLTRLGDVPGGLPAMSQDGRFAAWTSDRCALYIYELSTADEVATTQVPATRVPDGSYCRVQGIDDLGRVYLTLIDGEGTIHEVLMYDVRTDHWATVVGVPASNGHVPPVTYVTADGFAVQSEQRDGNAVASIEGAVDAKGAFVSRREVPVGQGLWSPDRSFVVDHEAEGIVVQPAADLNNRVVLDLPGDLSDHPPTDGLFWQTQWESARSLLVQVPVGEEDQVYRCDARSGACTVTNHTGAMAIPNNIRELPG